MYRVYEVDLFGMTKKRVKDSDYENLADAKKRAKEVAAQWQEDEPILKSTLDDGTLLYLAAQSDCGAAIRKID